jgi:hypothetical protein
MENATFDSICCVDLQSLLWNCPKMYQLWFVKQCSGFCGMGQMISRWDKEALSSCPNCELFEKPTTSPDATTAFAKTCFMKVFRTWKAGCYHTAHIQNY